MWELSFISEDDLLKHVEETIKKYGKQLESYDLNKFNKNFIDPIKLIFDKTVFNTDWDKIVTSEIFRQRDKTNTNTIGYFHQGIFKYIKNCSVPQNGRLGGWDVIYKNTDGIKLPDGSKVHTAFVEMKNKHNTMNSSSAAKTFIKMQSQLLKDDDCVCLLVEAIAKRSQNTKWETTVDGQRNSHKLIRRVSIDQFYEMVTGEEEAFYQICMALPTCISKVVGQMKGSIIPNDTVMDEILEKAEMLSYKPKDISIAMAFYLLGFSTYNGFNKLSPLTDL